MIAAQVTLLMMLMTWAVAQAHESVPFPQVDPRPAAYDAARALGWDPSVDGPLKEEVYYHVLVNSVCVLIFTLAMIPRFVNPNESVVNSTKDTEMDQFGRDRVQQYIMSSVMHDAFVEYAATEFVSENVSTHLNPSVFASVCSVGCVLFALVSRQCE